MTEEQFARGWKSQRGQIVELPSGNQARIIRTFPMTVGLKNGTIPNPLRGVLQKMMDTQSPAMPKKDANNPTIIKQMTDLMNNVICASVVNPKIVIPPEGENWDTWFPTEENAISIVDLSDEDKSYIYTVAQGGATDLETFREQQKQLMAALADVQKVPSATKRPARTNGARKRP